MELSEFTVDELRLIKSVMERVSLEIALRNLFQPLDLVASRLYAAVANGEHDEEALREFALRDAVQVPPPLPRHART